MRKRTGGAGTARAANVLRRAPGRYQRASLRWWSRHAQSLAHRVSMRVLRPPVKGLFQEAHTLEFLIPPCSRPTGIWNVGLAEALSRIANEADARHGQRSYATGLHL